MVKEAIRKYMFAHPGTDWYDWLPEIEMGLRMTTVRSHGLTPFFLMYKFDPIHLGDAAWSVRHINWESAKDKESIATELCAAFAKLRP